ncbi:hypothetical protein [Thalassobium sp. R2A62]|jgi:hypothetical protein|uniref:hypothetical protein n=1 Tax=Thalassobium sp. R2A62 TaxID=633131 RepID=UPI0001B1D193|nr:hypothetical protein [Thalassobium sp. R2A62]EET46244.1 hypothetical protein TR2A62_1392 [Thalassobium sp. R2A62]MDG1338813.1 hypothetical protein [Paracoccaceae bacterium]MDG1802342.1 hypothetical protein [Paracoccaceae bacterium]MDG2451915.1 hypothetical protein [Paracoccaceae bacterium]
MKQIAAVVFVASLTLTPAIAQEAEVEEKEGFSLMEEGAKLFFRGIMDEIEPALDDLQGLAQEMEPAIRNLVDEMGPAFVELMEQIDDLSHYEAPEILPNGDIIIRRKEGAPELELEGIEI